ncbi:MAG: undecaprenyl-diphosphate phosphatase [Thermoplasmata archaeon]
MLDWFTALLIGAIQGLLEWLPVSSSGQTTVVMVNFMGIRPEFAITFGLAVHIGTAMAVFARYPKQLLGMLDIRTATGPKKFYWVTTIISLLCALPIMLLLESTFDSELWTGLTITLLIGIALIITGIVLGRVPRRALRPVKDGSWPDYLLVGMAQAFAVLPGISRSGMTMAALLGRKFKTIEALTFSFLLSVPVSLAAFAYVVVFGEMVATSLWLLAIAAISSFVLGYISMDMLISVARSFRFSKTCLFLGSLAILLPLLLWFL